MSMYMLVHLLKHRHGNRPDVIHGLLTAFGTCFSTLRISSLFTHPHDPRILSTLLVAALEGAKEPIYGFAFPLSVTIHEDTRVKCCPLLCDSSYCIQRCYNNVI